MTMLNYLQGWIGMVALTALGNTISCYRGHQFLSDRLYTTASGEVNALMARLFGTWTFLSAVLRLYCALSIHNKGIYQMTMVSFALAFAHFFAECLVYKTASLSEMGVIMPLVISSVSFIWMAVAYTGLFHSSDSPEESRISIDEVRMARRNVKKYH